MNIKFIDNIIFGKDTKRTSQKEKHIWYFSLLILLLIFLYFLNDLLVFILQNNYIIAVIALSIYLYNGIKKSKWINGFQGFLISSVFLLIIFGVKFQESKYFLNLKKYSEYHHTQIGSELWFNIKVNNDDTYEIQFARPVDGKWSEVKKGKISKLIKQRYTDSGQEYHCFYLEDYPFMNERTMIAFENAFSVAELKFNNAHYILSEGNGDDAW